MDLEIQFEEYERLKDQLNKVDRHASSVILRIEVVTLKMFEIELPSVNTELRDQFLTYTESWIQEFQQIT